MFENLSERLEHSFKILKGEGKITEINVAETLKDVRRALLDADVNYKVAKSFTDTVKQKAMGMNVLSAVKPSQMMVKIVHDELTELMGGTAAELKLENRPAIILMSGLQGSGKTTSSAKLAVKLTYKNQWGGIPTVEKVVVGNAAKEATINYLTKVVTPSTTAKEDFSLPEITENTKYVSVIIPQEDVKQLTIVIDGKNFVYDNGTPFKLESGKITTVNLEVGRDEIKLGDVKITDWEDGSTFSGEALN